MNEAEHKRVLVTRPRDQAAEFIQLLEENAYKTLALPSIEIQAINLTKPLKQKLRSLDETDLLIFVSANAVNQAKKLLQQLHIQPADISARIAVIGKATREAANKSGFEVSVEPDSGFNSDALLALEDLQSKPVSGKKILIVRGENGLEQLADTLRERGATVSYAEVYKRRIPTEDYAVSRQQISANWQDMQINYITVTSNESLQNLYDMLEPPGKVSMLDVQLIVPSKRCYQLANSLGFHAIKIAESATNHHMLMAIDSCE